MKKRPCVFCSKVVGVKDNYVPKWLCKCGCYEYPVNPITCMGCDKKIKADNVASHSENKAYKAQNE